MSSEFAAYYHTTCNWMQDLLLAQATARHKRSEFAACYHSPSN